MTLKRRTFLGTAGAATALSAPMLHAAAHGGMPRVVIVGGGAGGATVARYLGKDAADKIDVTLIEPTRTYYTCFFSNLYLGGFWDYDKLGHSYATLASDYGVNVVHDWAVAVDRDAKVVRTAGGYEFPYDKLVLSPGIDFVDDSVPGWTVNDQDVMPHSYKAGTQTALLKAQVMAMPDGGTFAMVAPPNPYRCPPGPYERVSMIAHYLRENNPSAKIIVADPKEKFSKMALFQTAWNDLYPGMVDWIGPEFGGGNVSVDPANMTVDIDGQVENVDVCNVIPAQKAGLIAHQAGLTDGNWAPVEPEAMTSTMDDNVHILGDAANQGDMPKSGFSANSQAKVVANAINAALTDGTKFPARYSNTCWSLVDTDNGVKVGASYEPAEGKITSTGGFISEVGETDEVRKATYQESLGWYAGITADMFG